MGQEKAHWWMKPTQGLKKPVKIKSNGIGDFVQSSNN
jgi:hypothetical protein